MELVRQPFYLVLMASSTAFIAFLGSIYYFALGDDVKLVKDSALAVVFLSGLFGAVFSASSSVAREIQTGTALAVMSKPIGKIPFLLGKYLGVSGALSLLTFVNLLAVLVSTKIAFDSYGEPDLRALGIFYGGMALAFLIGAFMNYFLDRPFVGNTVFALVIVLTVAFIAISFLGRKGGVQSFGADIDWRLIPATLLLLFALWILAGLALACTTRLDMVATLAICSAFFVVGLMSDYLFGIPSSQGNGLASVAYAVTPNWQVFWMSDALEGDKVIPWAYVGRAFEYALGYLAMTLALAVALFQDRELN
jgi:ABC-2 type transport system permease protein